MLPLLVMAQNSGKCGDNLTWTFDESNGTLVISGEGKMENYEWWEGGHYPPWGALKISKVIINDGVSTIGDCAFYRWSKECEMTSIEIPSSVTSIGENAFTRCTNLSSITIPYSVTSIGTSAFSYSGLTSIEIPSSVTSIASRAFEGCSNLSSVTIPNSITSIESGAFSNCGLTSVEIPSSVTSIGSRAFEGCTSIQSIIIPDGVTLIKEKTFSECTSLTSITIPNGVVSIGSCAFEGCSSLTSFTIPQGMISAGSIGDEAFKRFSGLVSIDIPDGISKIGAEAFRECNNLQSVTFGKDVESIGTTAFAFCTRLKEVVIPDNVTAIEKDAFLYCENLEYVSIGDGVIDIKDQAFNHCFNISRLKLGKSVKIIGDLAFPGLGLTEVTCLATDPPTTKSQNFRESSVKNTILFVQEQSVEAYNAKEPWNRFKVILATNSSGKFKLTYMVDGEVYKSYEIKYGSTIIPEPEPTKAGCTFSGWSKMPKEMPTEDVTITGTFSWSKIAKDKVVYQVTDTLNNYSAVIGNENASGKINIVSDVEIDYVYKVTSIADKAFNGCKGITSIDIPATITNIGERAFANIDKLTDVTIYAENVPETDRTAFEDSYIDYVTLHVPYGSLLSYKTIGPWKNFKNIVATDGSTPEIPETKKCEKPTISFANGQLSFASGTDGAEFVYEISVNDSGTGSAVKLGNTTTYHVSVYATKEGYENSEMVMKDITMSVGLKGDVNDDGKIDVEDVVGVVNIILDGNE